METIRSRLKSCAGLALLAMLALAFVPSLSQALQSSPFAGIGVCSTPGSLPTGAPGGMPTGHCPLCAHVLDGPVGVPATATGFTVAPAAMGVRLAVSDRPSQQRLAWAYAPARAPPALFL